ncbi:hypothetical protein SCP_0805140 [Sparassis crispa]|uniref:Uncharacterized protein n=1 Tax=Sparassis crispa TaxID=139825 RepID=A0A401GUX7_9APHY|nr:hypothetical protein SCP_0805140 [Sparassis crispa]GBE85990.1 hypothetical protein SCP_0805140 [Sparassis crispa]
MAYAYEPVSMSSITTPQHDCQSQLMVYEGGHTLLAICVRSTWTLHQESKLCACHKSLKPKAMTQLFRLVFLPHYTASLTLTLCWPLDRFQAMSPLLLMSHSYVYSLCTSTDQPHDCTAMNTKE